MSSELGLLECIDRDKRRLFPNGFSTNPIVGASEIITFFSDQSRIGSKKNDMIHFSFGCERVSDIIMAIHQGGYLDQVLAYMSRNGGLQGVCLDSVTLKLLVKEYGCTFTANMVGSYKR